MKTSDFVIRVYGIYINESRGILVSDEIIKGMSITKFPGGGLEYGEGTIDCLKREMIEESGFEFDVLSHFYTTDFFVESAFRENQQVVSIYYWMKPVNKFDIKIASHPFEFESEVEGAQSFRFVKLNDLNPVDFNLAIDRHVAEILKKS